MHPAFIFSLVISNTQTHSYTVCIAMHKILKLKGSGSSEREKKRAKTIWDSGTFHQYVVYLHTGMGGSWLCMFIDLGFVLINDKTMIRCVRKEGLRELNTIQMGYSIRNPIYANKRTFTCILLSHGCTKALKPFSFIPWVIWGGMFNTKMLHNNYFFLHYEWLLLYHLGQKNKLQFPLRLIYYYCRRYCFVSGCIAMYCKKSYWGS